MITARAVRDTALRPTESGTDRRLGLQSVPAGAPECAAGTPWGDATEDSLRASARSGLAGRIGEVLASRRSTLSEQPTVIRCASVVLARTPKLDTKSQVRPRFTGALSSAW